MFSNKIFFTILLLFFIPSSLYIGSIKIGPLISGLILIYYISYTILKKDHITKISFLNTIYSLKQLINLSILNYFSILLYLSIQYLFFSAIYQSFICKIQTTSIKHVKRYFYIFLTSLIGVNTLVYLNIIPQFGHGYNLSLYGVNDKSGFTGVFDNYTASIIFAFTVICLISFLFDNKKNKFLTFICIIAGVFFTYKTYFRTGYICLIIGSITYFIFTTEINFKKKIIYSIFILSITIAAFSYLFINDEIFKYRITDKSIYNQDDTNTNKRLGSGRVDFFMSGIAIFNESNIALKFFGYGLPETTNLMENKVGMKIFMHNEFMNSLIQNGIIGLCIFIAFDILLFIKINKYTKSKYYPLSLSCYITLNTYYILQGGPFPIIYVFISYSILLQKMDQINRLTSK